MTGKELFARVTARMVVGSLLILMGVFISLPIMGITALIGFMFGLTIPKSLYVLMLIVVLLVMLILLIVSKIMEKVAKRKAKEAKDGLQ